MTLRRFLAKDFEEVVDMYYNFTKEVYPNRAISEKYFFYRAVQNWITKDVDLIVSIQDNILTGFSMCYKDDLGGITEPVYQCEVCFVKPEYRKSRAAFLLYKNAYAYAKEQRLLVSCNARLENRVDEMIEKHFKLTPTFKLLEG